MNGQKYQVSIQYGMFEVFHQFFLKFMKEKFPSMCHLDYRAEDGWSPARSTWKDEYLGLLMGLRAAGKYRPTGSSSLRLSAPETEPMRQI